MAKAKRKSGKKKADAKKKAAGKKKTDAKKKASGKKKADAKKKAAGKKKTDAKKKASGKKKADAKKKASGKKKADAKKKASGKKKAGAKKKASGKGGKSKKALADKIDRHTLYQLSVQSPEADIEFFVERYEALRGCEPKVLREDFCGTAFLSATWAASADDRRAVGVDLDRPTLDWGRKHNLARIPAEAQGRVDLREANVLDGGGEAADLTCAMNFSYGVFKTREELRRYFEVVYENLADEGVFITELYGGTEAIVEVLDDREIEDPDGKVKPFTYIWEQAEYNPITHDTVCHIHFKLGDGSKIKRAFTYEWRLWTIPEMRELMHEVGFSSVRVFWEATDEDGDGTGEYYATEKEDNQESWLVYLVAGK